MLTSLQCVCRNLNDGVTGDKRFAYLQPLRRCHSLNTGRNCRVQAEGLVDASLQVLQLGQSGETWTFVLFIILINFVLKLLDDIRASRKLEEQACQSCSSGITVLRLIPCVCHGFSALKCLPSSNDN